VGGAKNQWTEHELYVGGQVAKKGKQNEEVRQRKKREKKGRRPPRETATMVQGCTIGKREGHEAQCISKVLGGKSGRRNLKDSQSCEGATVCNGRGRYEIKVNYGWDMSTQQKKMQRIGHPSSKNILNERLRRCLNKAGGRRVSGRGRGGKIGRRKEEKSPMRSRHTVA